MPSSKRLVLITGITGFIGTDVALAFLRAGWFVRGTVRSKDKADQWIALFPQYSEQCQFVIVEDIAHIGAFNEAVKGCDAIAHTASPYTFALEDNEKDMLLPAINGTKNVLEATKLEPRVKRVVLTSSIAAYMDPLTLPAAGMTFSSEDWNPTTYEQAKQSPIAGYVYSASKSLAECVFWDYVKDKKPSWSGTVLCPAQVFGPPSQHLSSLSSLNTSIAQIQQAIDGTWKTSGIPPTIFPVYTDVRNLGLAHVRAVELDVAKGQRYLFVEGHFKNEQIVNVAAKYYPELKSKLPEVEASKVSMDDHFKTDTRKTEEHLGIAPAAFESVIRDSIGRLMNLDKIIQLKVKMT